jgi:hypothetical protein
LRVFLNNLYICIRSQCLPSPLLSCGSWRHFHLGNAVSVKLINQSLPSSTDIRNGWSFTSAFICVFTVCCLGMGRISPLPLPVIWYVI